MFSFEITPLGNLFFGLSIIVFGSILLAKRDNLPLLSLLFISLGVIFYAHDLITLFIGWEVMSWSSYLLIAQRARVRTALKYIIFNLGAGFALLGAIVLIYSFTGTFSYSELIFNQIPISFRTPIYILLLITIFVKSGIMPLHYWVVDTYAESEDSFTAILSAMLSKAGIFLFLTLFVKLIGYKYIESEILNIVAWLGVITSIVATFKAISQDSLKRLLAYSSIAQIGYIVTILTIIHGNGIEAGVYHTIIHTFVKLLLFMNVASIIYITGKSKFSELGGLIYEYPVLFILLLIGIIGLAGVPPLGGFSSKFLIYTTLLEEQRGLLLVAIMFSSASAFLYCYKLIYGIYLGHSHGGERKPLPIGYYVSQYIGAILLIVLGIFPSLAIELFNPILGFLGFKPTVYQSLFELNSSFASFNGGVIMGVFGAVFIVILLIAISIRNNRTVKNRDKLDISYCGEVPDPDVNLHYGSGMGRELRRIKFIGFILNNSLSPYWRLVALTTRDGSMILKRLYAQSTQSVGLLIVIIFTILLYMGVS